jgi:hypothetical protein
MGLDHLWRKPRLPGLMDLPLMDTLRPERLSRFLRETSLRHTTLCRLRLANNYRIRAYISYRYRCR